MKMLQQFHAVLGLPAISSTLVNIDPLVENPQASEAA